MVPYTFPREGKRQQAGNNHIHSLDHLRKRLQRTDIHIYISQHSRYDTIPVIFNQTSTKEYSRCSYPHPTSHIKTRQYRRRSTQAISAAFLSSNTLSSFVMLPALESPLSFSLPTTTLPSRPSIWCSMLTWSKAHILANLFQTRCRPGEKPGYQYLWSFEPFVRTDEPPDDDHGHWTSIDENRPIHARRTRRSILSATRPA